MNYRDYQAYINALTAALPLISTRVGDGKASSIEGAAICAANRGIIPHLDAKLTYKMIESRLGDHKSVTEKLFPGCERGATFHATNYVNIQQYTVNWANEMLDEFKQAIQQAPVTPIKVFTDICWVTYTTHNASYNEFNELHNDTGPALVATDGGGEFVYYWRGLCHRVGGAADDDGAYWLFGKQFSQFDYDKECLNKTLPDWAEYDEYMQALNSATK